MTENELLIILAGRIKRGDMEAFEELYRMTNRYVYFYAKSLMQNEEEARDLVQDTYLAIFEHIGTLKSDESIRSWIGGIVFNQGHKKLRRRKELLADEGAESFFDNVEESDRELLPEEAADYKETISIVQDIINSLPDVQRAALIAYYFDEKKVFRIAEEAMCSVGTVKSRLNYARQTIRSEIERRERKMGIPLHSFTGSLIVWALRNMYEQIELSSVERVSIMNSVKQQMDVAKLKIKIPEWINGEGQGMAGPAKAGSAGNVRISGPKASHGGVPGNIGVITGGKGAGLSVGAGSAFFGTLKWKAAAGAVILMLGAGAVVGAVRLGTTGSAASVKLGQMAENAGAGHGQYTEAEGGTGRGSGRDASAAGQNVPAGEHKITIEIESGGMDKMQAGEHLQIPGAGQIDVADAESAIAKAQEFATYVNARFQYRMVYPKEFTIISESENGDGAALEDKDGNQLAIWGSYNTTSCQSGAELLAERMKFYSADKIKKQEADGNLCYLVCETNPNEYKEMMEGVFGDRIVAFAFTHKDGELSSKETIEKMKQSLSEVKVVEGEETANADETAIVDAEGKLLEADIKPYLGQLNSVFSQAVMLFEYGDDGRKIYDLVDKGDYYEVSGKLCNPWEFPRELIEGKQVGDRVYVPELDNTLTIEWINYNNGWNSKRPEISVSYDKPRSTYTIFYWDEDEKYYEHAGHEGVVLEPFYEGKLQIRKDAVFNIYEANHDESGQYIDSNVDSMSAEDFFNGDRYCFNFNYTTDFDENGFIIAFGDHGF